MRLSNAKNMFVVDGKGTLAVLPSLNSRKDLNLLAMHNGASKQFNKMKPMSSQEAGKQFQPALTNPKMQVCHLCPPDPLRLSLRL